MLDKITEQEYKMLTKWRDWYAWENEPASTCQTIPIREVLHEWADEKQELYELLGKNLVITKDVTFQKGEEELRSDMYNALDRYSRSSTRIERQGWRFKESFVEWVSSTYPTYPDYYWDDPLTEEQRKANEINAPIKEYLYDLIAYSTLIKNSYAGKTFSIILPNGKPYVIQNGCKPLKPLAKIAEIFNLEHFEDFRICHSQVLNLKTLKGKLSLSIHPLDYWTMSDNECGWDSCMNWRDCGGYRQGTVEMMNSPCVVVAYLSASDNMNIGNIGEWSNKKWRSLYIVNKDLIMNVKGYPYSNENLDKEVLAWLKELAKTNMGWEYLTDEPEMYNYNSKFINPEEPDSPFSITFATNNMYNDIGSISHYIYIGETLKSSTASLWSSCESRRYYLFNYSGKSQCVSCGLIQPSLDCESNLCCPSCEYTMRCDECGERLYDGDYYWVGDTRLCCCCYNDLTARCGCCEEDYFDEDMATIHFLVPYDETVADYTDIYGGSLVLREGEEHVWSIQELTLCPHCLSEFAEEYLKPDTNLVKYQTRDNYRFYGAYINDLTQRGIESFLSYDAQTEIKDKSSWQEVIRACSMTRSLFRVTLGWEY